jgi:DNA-binding CsgD family transcriptional regulator
MNRRSRKLEPKSDARLQRGTVSVVRRLDVIDGRLNVILRGSGPDDITPATDVSLEPGLAAELSSVIAGHDFAAFPVAAGLVGDDHVWRTVRIAESAYFAVLLERSTIARRAARLARRFALAAPEAELLRLTVGGYAPEEIARRMGQDKRTVDRLRAELTESLGCVTLREVIEMVGSRKLDRGAAVLGHVSGLHRELERLSSF